VRWPPETFLCWKLEGLAARGMRVTVASRSVFDPAARLRGVDLLEVPGRGGDPRARKRLVWREGLKLLGRSPRRLVKLVRGVRRTPPATLRRYGGRTGLLAMCLPLARLRPDVVHFEWNTAATTYLPLFDVWGCPVVVSCHGSDLTVYPRAPGWAHYSERLPELLRRVTLAHCVSDSLRREAIGYGLDPAKARVIHQGVDPELFRPANGQRRNGRELHVLAVGWMWWVKGYEYALLAIRGLVDRGVPVRFEVLGGDPDSDGGQGGEHSRLRHTVADLGLEERVHFAGAVPSEEVAHRLRQAHVLLLSSVDEGLPTVVLEAMASGVPVVATECGGVAEAVTDGREGFLVAPRDSDALADALFRLWRDPGLRARMGEAGRATATSRFTLQRQLDEVAAMYGEVARA
jgi:colanic acid/amylovoran biosynthesis glycosyltransferase